MFVRLDCSIAGIGFAVLLIYGLVRGWFRNVAMVCFEIIGSFDFASLVLRVNRDCCVSELVGTDNSSFWGKLHGLGKHETLQFSFVWKAIVFGYSNMRPSEITVLKKEQHDCENHKGYINCVSVLFLYEFVRRQLLTCFPTRYHWALLGNQNENLGDPLR